LIFSNDTSHGVSKITLFPRRRKDTVEPKEEAPAASSGGTDDVLAQLRAKMNKG